MKFIHYLEKITGVGIFPLTSLSIFFLFFLAMTIWTMKADKEYIGSLKQIPFPEEGNQ